MFTAPINAIKIIYDNICLWILEIRSVGKASRFE